MLDTIQYVGVVAALLSCAFWTRSATIRIMPLWFRTLHLSESLPAIIERQARMNAAAALFAAVAAASQAAELFVLR
jgi:hypothetical protein